MKRKILSLVVTLVLMVALMPATVFAAGVTGNVTSNNNAPVVNSITIATMTPNVAHTVSISITDVNTLADIAQIDIWIFYDATGLDDGAPGGAWDCDEEAIYKWVSTGDGTWSMEDGSLTPPGDHSWAIGAGTEPTMSGTTGTWILNFTPGKLAWEAVGGDGANPEWDVKVTATDAALTHSLTVYSTAMSAYSSIATDVASITFGAGVALGATAYIDTPADDHNFATQVLSNDAYALQVSSAATWTGAGTLTLDPVAPDAAGEFGLKIDDAGDGSGIPTTPVAVTTSPVTIAGHGTDARVATTDTVAEAVVSQNLYMSLTLYSTGIPVGAYSGTRTLTVVNS